MVDTPYSGIPHLEPNQDEPEVTVNAAFDAFDTEMNASVALPATSSGSFALIQAQQYGGSFFILTPTSPGPPAPFNVNLLATGMRPFAVLNETAQAATVQISGQVSPPAALAAGALGLFVSDGIRVRRIV